MLRKGRTESFGWNNDSVAGFGVVSDECTGVSGGLCPEEEIREI
uniref:Uncharacterized protein n=1 Tax=Setaria digitata TaxID=48799 RepID=A0A915PJU9_9BILA